MAYMAASPCSFLLVCASSCVCVVRLGKEGRATDIVVRLVSCVLLFFAGGVCDFFMPRRHRVAARRPSILAATLPVLAAIAPVYVDRHEFLMDVS